jgi:hypothetical protein
MSAQVREERRASLLWFAGLVAYPTRDVDGAGPVVAGRWSCASAVPRARDQPRFCRPPCAHITSALYWF